MNWLIQQCVEPRNVWIGIQGHIDLKRYAMSWWMVSSNALPVNFINLQHMRMWTNLINGITKAARRVTELFILLSGDMYSFLYSSTEYPSISYRIPVGVNWTKLRAICNVCCKNMINFKPNGPGDNNVPGAGWSTWQLTNLPLQVRAVGKVQEEEVKCFGTPCSCSPTARRRLKDFVYKTHCSSEN
jgi:hypothetical protein